MSTDQSPPPLRDTFMFPAATWHLVWTPAVSLHDPYITHTHRNAHKFKQRNHTLTGTRMGMSMSTCRHTFSIQTRISTCRHYTIIDTLWDAGILGQIDWVAVVYEMFAHTLKAVVLTPMLNRSRVVASVWKYTSSQPIHAEKDSSSSG